MNDADVDFDQRRLLGLASRHWRLVALCGLAGACLAAAQLLASGLPYTGETQVIVGEPLTVQSLLNDTPSSKDQGRLVDSEQRRMESDRVTKAVEAELPSGHRPYTAKLSSGTTTNVVTIIVTSPDPDVATAAANAYGTAYLKVLAQDNTAVIAAAEKQLTSSVASINEQLTKLESALSSATDTSLPKVQAIVAPVRTSLLDQKVSLQRQLDQVALVKSVGAAGGARVIQPAESARTSVVSSVFPIASGLLLGLLVGVGLLWLREAQGGRVVDGADLISAGLEPRSVWPVPVVLPTKPSARSRPTPTEVISLRGVAATMWPSRSTGDRANVTLIAPIDRDPGASTTLALWLGEQVQHMHRRVLLVNADQDAPLADRYPHAGLTTLDGPGAAGRLARVRQVSERFLLIDAFGDGGPSVENPAFEQLLSALSREVDLVIVAGPGLMTAAESIQVSPLVDRVVLLARSGRTRRKVVRNLVSLFSGHTQQTPTLQHPDVVIHGTRAPRWMRSRPRDTGRAVVPTPAVADQTPGA